MAAHVLVIEDSPTQALWLKVVLQKAGLRSTLALNGQEGLAAAEKELPNAVVLDVNLPDLDGFEVCRALRRMPAMGAVPIIMLTVKDRAADTLIGLEMGADDYIPKDDFAEINLLQALQELGISS